MPCLSDAPSASRGPTIRTRAEFMLRGVILFCKGRRGKARCRRGAAGVESGRKERRAWRANRRKQAACRWCWCVFFASFHLLFCLKKWCGGVVAGRGVVDFSSAENVNSIIRFFDPHPSPLILLLPFFHCLVLFLCKIGRLRQDAGERQFLKARDLIRKIRRQPRVQRQSLLAEF